MASHGPAASGAARRGSGAAWQARPGKARRVWAWHGKELSNQSEEQQVSAATATTNGNGSNPTTDAAEIQIDRIEAETIRVPILGTSPLIVHRFSEKAKRQMLDAMQGRKSPKASKDPAAEYEASRYRLEDGSDGFPVLAFKDATVGGARFYHGVTMTALKQFMFFRGEVGDDGRALARLEGEPEMREDVVRVGRGGTDLRYRGQFREWRTELLVTYVTSALTRGSVLSLIDAGGMGVGVGEWRPEKNGDFGTYQIAPDRDVEVVS
jgi:hypothetical protein